MFDSKLARRVLFLGALSLGSLTVACGPKTEGVKTADHVKAAPMPEGGDWRGVYYNQTYGFLHITETSGAVQGAWRTTNGSKWGELYGQIEGDMLRFSWTEHKVGVVGPNSTSEGKGYFLYRIPRPGEAHELEGEWGLGENEVGHSWNCVKQINMEPDPKSVRPNELENSVGAVGFDGAKGNEAEEEPAEAEEGAEGDEAPEEESDTPQGI